MPRQSRDPEVYKFVDLEEEERNQNKLDTDTLLKLILEKLDE